MRWGSFLAGVAAALVVLALAGWVYLANFDVAATSAHSGPVGKVIHGTMQRSVRAGAAGIKAPASFTAGQVADGAAEYKAMCEGCHGGVGAERAFWIEGMNPAPPDLARIADEWSSAELFWIVKNGVRMTGMPAFGPTHDDATVWNITAFVEALPEMPAEQYAAYSSEHGAEEGAEGHSHAPGTPPHED